MEYEPIKEELRGVATAILTPFADDLSVDHAALASNAQEIVGQGIATIFACANVSEYHSLSHAERISVTETTVEAIPSETTVLAGAGGSTKTAIDLATNFENIGVDAIMVMPPMHTYQHERGLLDYYRKLGDSVEIPLVPYLRGFDPSVDFVADLTRLDSVIGIKWTIENIPKFVKSVEAGSDNIVWINGLGEPYAIPLHVEGAEGQSSGIGNFEPTIGIALFEALQDDDLEQARRVRNATLPYMNFRERTGAHNSLPGGQSIPALKAGLEFAGLVGGPVRDPLVDLSDTEYERAHELYEELSSFMGTEL